MLRKIRTSHKVSRTANRKSPVKARAKPLDERRQVKAWLRNLREQRGLTQKELAEAVGVDPRTILNAESPKSGFPRGLEMIKILRELGALSERPGVEPSPLLSRLEKVEAGIDELLRRRNGRSR